MGRLAWAAGASASGSVPVSADGVARGGCMEGPTGAAAAGLPMGVVGDGAVCAAGWL